MSILVLSSWDFFRFLETEPTARRYLAASYTQQGFNSAEKLAFHQSSRLLYTVKHARQYYETAESCDLLIRPLLLYYGCTHLLKALILFKDPAYPQNSRMLQHGVTSRKVKRTPYHMLDDEVRPQKEGLFAHAAKLLRIPFLQERYTMRELFSLLPELAFAYSNIVQTSSWQKIAYSKERGEVCFPSGTCGSLLYSQETFLDYLQRHAQGTVEFALCDKESPLISPDHFPKCLRVKEGLDIGTTLADHPYFAQTLQGYLFWNVEGNDVPPPRWAVHFLLLYLLGMLCRYEAEIWGDFVCSHSYSELVLVEQFFATHLSQFPQMVSALIQIALTKQPHIQR